MNPPTMQEVDREVAELEEKIAGLNQLAERKALLLTYKSILERLSPNGNGSQPTPAIVPIADAVQPTTGGVGSETSNSPTVNCIIRVLSASAKSMKVPDIVKAMFAAGWTGSGDQERDKTTVYNALYNNMGTRFTREEEGFGR